MRKCLSVLMLALPALLAPLPGAAQSQPARNRLAQEASPYLQQHADNPVNWQPWGPEALRRAREEGRLIFVSVGYSACHWCHVMEEESFLDPEIAAYLNAHFVSILIDRERRPDLDARLMAVTAMRSGSAGWPNGVFLTPEGKPFFGATYLPRADFARLLRRIVEIWQHDPDGLRREAEAVAAKLREAFDQGAPGGEISPPEILGAARRLLEGLDEFNGGFGEAPKFPEEQALLLLLDQAERSGEGALRDAALATLRGMIRGGIHDQLGGGFHRYAVDPQWQLPHFEKMLYNQALIGRALLRGYLLSGDESLARAARRSMDFVLREMQAPEGGFHAALDADSPAPDGTLREGAYYTWTPEQIRAALPPEMAEPFMQAFGVSAYGPLEGASSLHLQGSLGEAAREMGITRARLEALLERLRKARSRRPPPARDEKIVLAWNAEMIATLAEAGWLLDRPDYTRAARRAARFIRQKMRTDAGLQRAYFHGQAGPQAQLDDHAAYGRALLALYDFAPALDGGEAAAALSEAERVAREMLRRFQDPGRPLRMLEAAAGGGALSGPIRPLDDAELASGNALALGFLNALDRRSGHIPPRAPELADSLAGQAAQAPLQRAGLLRALAETLGGSSGPLRYGPGGAVRLRLGRGGKLEFAFRPGWHVNARHPLDENLIATEITADGVPLPDAAYPAPVIRTLGFSPEPLALYEEDFTLDLPEGSQEIRITLQPCNDHLCLPPQELSFRRW